MRVGEISGDLCKIVILYFQRYSPSFQLTFLQSSENGFSDDIQLFMHFIDRTQIISESIFGTQRFSFPMRLHFPFINSSDNPDNKNDLFSRNVLPARFQSVFSNLHL